MQAAARGDRVQVHYVGRLEDGSTFDTSREDGPIGLVLGDGAFLPAFERAIIGMVEGDERTVTVPSDEAYGPHRAELVRTVDRSNAPKDLPLEPGLQLGTTGPDGQDVVITIMEVTPESVTIDANHPLAGKALTFEIELIAVG